jgi:4-hydroxybenzoate polyprenyltransferase
VVSCIFWAQACGWKRRFPDLLGFSYFCLAASSVYILNDLTDIEADRLHPMKRVMASDNLILCLAVSSLLSVD